MWAFETKTKREQNENEIEKTRTTKENSIYREGFAEGHRIGLRKGKVLKIDEALYEELKARASGRVDVAPGPDSIRPEGKAHD